MMKYATAKSPFLMVQVGFLCIAIMGCPPPEPQVEIFLLPGDVELEMITIPSGTFMMGSTNGDLDETPVHEVTITQDFQLGKYEITKAQWEAVMGTTPWVDSGQPVDFTGKELCCYLSDPNSPAVYLKWHDAQAYVTALNNLTGETFRLPTEAEWEYACRAGTTTEYYFGNNSAKLDDHAWWSENLDAESIEEPYAHVVGQKLPNDFGLFDMYGNVWEWCEDAYDSSYYSSSPTNDPTGPIDPHSNKVLRGASWLLGAPGQLPRSATRGVSNASSFGLTLGFRLARQLPVQN